VFAAPNLEKFTESGKKRKKKERRVSLAHLTCPAQYGPCYIFGSNLIRSYCLRLKLIAFCRFR
uniref:Uncharacterized protein n=1 Tax=Oryza brachyantha TaxID=4533 RepID=J3LXW4_ORYBR